MIGPLSKIIKTSLVYLSYYGKAIDIFRYITRNRYITILMYHRFSDHDEPFKVTQGLFSRQLDYLRKRYSFISLNQYLDVLNNPSMYLPPNPIAITIDDGYMDNYVYAYPVLKHYSIPATIFITTDFISDRKWLWSNKLEYILRNSINKHFRYSLGECEEQFSVDTFENWHKTQLKIFGHCAAISNEQKDELLDDLANHLNVSVPDQTSGDFQPLTWDQIKEMLLGDIEFGSHTCSHPILSRLNEKELQHEIVDSKRIIESNLNMHVQAFCYPNGSERDFNESTKRLAESAGYECAMSTIPGINPRRPIDLFSLKRISINTDNSMKMAWKLMK
jgi:peptidoglycan/xylan/chitin deacetylase (PgdA/CDA1 family)